jgi:hypothetical protein
MSRSNPPRSSIVARVRESSPAAGASPAHGRSFRRRLSIRLAATLLWLHIYVSMFGLAAVLFFSVTGITLNHPTWFFGESERSVRSEGTMNVKWLHLNAPAPTSSSEEGSDRSREVARLEIVEHLRKVNGVRGALVEFKTDERECLVTFKGPGYSADAFIDRASGGYDVTQSYHGFLAVMNDLHKGRDTGPVWSVLIDVTAALMTLISATGLALLFYLKLRRVPGLVVTLIGTVVVVAAYFLWVP